MAFLFRKSVVIILIELYKILLFFSRWLVLAIAMVRFYMEKGTHKGLYKSIQKTLKFFQTFAMLEVSFQWCHFSIIVIFIGTFICWAKINRILLITYHLWICLKRMSTGINFVLYTTALWFSFSRLLTDSPLFNWWVLDLILIFGTNCLEDNGWLVFLFKELYLLLCLWLGSKWVQESLWCGSLLTV